MIENLGIPETKFPGTVGNITNRLQEMRKQQIKSCFSIPDIVEHRMESIAKVKNVEFINDSKATNANSTWFSLESCHDPVIWIVGTNGKLSEYYQLRDAVKRKVKAIVALGSDTEKIKEAFGDISENIIETSCINEAVEEAYKMGVKNDVVLFSPACASFDLFHDYCDRGDQFKISVREL